jgi:hypothetical protein
MRTSLPFHASSYQPGLASWLAAICLAALAGCGRLHGTTHRPDAAIRTDANAADANVDLSVIRDAPIKDDLTTRGETAATGEAAQLLCDNGLVWQGDYVIASLADLDRLRGYTLLRGSLLINSDELVDLHGLECLHTVDGSVEIGHCPLAGANPEPPCTSNPNLTTLEGLGIVYVRASFRVHDAPLLRDLHGLETLRSASQTFIDRLPALRSVAGLENIEPWAWIHIYENPLLEDLSPFAGKGLGGSLLLTDNPALTSLKGLESSTVMESFQIISSPRLTSLAGLGLYYAHGDVVVQDLDLIVDLTGLEALSHVDALTISGNASLANILALSKLRAISELVVRGNPSLTSLAGLGIVETSLKSVDIENNSRLADLKGFEQVTEMGYLRVEGNQTLGSLDGLAGLATVGDGGLYLDDNEALTSLGGLRALARVDGDISVEGNEALQDTTVLENITFSGSWLTIMHNPALPNCQAWRVYEAQTAKGWKGVARICGNLTDGCPGTADCVPLN